MDLQPDTQMVEVKRWADRGLYEVVGRHFHELNADEASIMLRILDHMHAVDRIFQHHLRGVPHDFKAARSQIIPDLAPLSNSALATDDWFASYTNSLTVTELEEPIDFTFTSGRQGRMQRGEILLHVCLHGTYHRGNAGAVLQLKGLRPARDSITDYLEDMR
jgi:uncharacterized damage-inducible protein DinB